MFVCVIAPKIPKPCSFAHALPCLAYGNIAPSHWSVATRNLSYFLDSQLQSFLGFSINWLSFTAPVCYTGTSRITSCINIFTCFPPVFVIHIVFIPSARIKCVPTLGTSICDVVPGLAPLHSISDKTNRICVNARYFLTRSIRFASRSQRTRRSLLRLIQFQETTSPRK